MRTRLIVAVAILAGCSTDPAVQSGRDSGVRHDVATSLLAGRSGRLREGVDSLALARLLEAVPPEARTLVRASFEERTDDLQIDLSVIEGVEGLDSLLAAVTAPGRQPRPMENSVWSRPVTFVLREDDDSEEIRIVRRAGREGGDEIILSRATANRGQVTDALRVLAALREQQGMVPAQDHVARVTVRGAGPSGPQPASWSSYLDRTLADLKASPRRAVSGLGARVLVVEAIGQ